MPLVRTTVEFSADQKAYIAQKSSELGISQSALVRMAVKQDMDRGEAESTSKHLPSVSITEPDDFSGKDSEN
jgi:hypothetical protein